SGCRAGDLSVCGADEDGHGEGGFLRGYGGVAGGDRLRDVPRQASIEAGERHWHESSFPRVSSVLEERHGDVT
ncbi:MAG: hypothetical protein JWP44_5071, partial [Mucilaginibacter sp.]|nr:hypothetical protein [Mucilaginibacter sp.]